METVCVIGGAKYTAKPCHADVVYPPKFTIFSRATLSSSPAAHRLARGKTRERHEADAQHAYAYSFGYCCGGEW
jgi:hypothetical protein